MFISALQRIYDNYNDELLHTRNAVCGFLVFVSLYQTKITYSLTNRFSFVLYLDSIMSSTYIYSSYLQKYYYFCLQTSHVHILYIVHQKFCTRIFYSLNIFQLCSQPRISSAKPSSFISGSVSPFPDSIIVNNFLTTS